MIYGANGYSAQLIIDELLKRGVKPILAGRNREAVEEIADKNNCEFRVFDLEDQNLISDNLSGMHTVINCAGPFRYTAPQLISACIISKTNYIDITGEIEAIEYAWRNNDAAIEAGITLLPSAGFDVIPTDCMAKRLSENIENPDSLELAIINNGKISRGTFLTTLEMMKERGKVRVDKEIIDSKIAEYIIDFKSDRLNFKGVSIPWGDVSSAYYSTGIPNIKVYLAVPKIIFVLRKVLLLLIKLLSVKFIFNLINKIISKVLSGPDKKTRDESSAIIWGRVKNIKGESSTAAFRFIDGYSLTAVGAADCSQLILSGDIKPGAVTPSIMIGHRYMDQFVKEKII
ncbi:MAG: NAD(P)H-binding protein [Ignavibacteriae bacterium]|nr:hypothetical protein [Ignavibacteriota bacterium]NOG99964.1 NAD(P)H-binding protein [Ignavibacteriota bacterium]